MIAAIITGVAEVFRHVLRDVALIGLGIAVIVAVIIFLFVRQIEKNGWNN